MRANKSSKNLLRISGLALVFMLAVALLVSAISFTRVSAGVNTENVAEANSQVYDPGEHKKDRYFDIGINKTEWTWAVPFDGTPDSNGNLAVFTYRPHTYTNFYGRFDSSANYGGIDGFEANDNRAKLAPRVWKGSLIELYAYYRLPDFFVNYGANIGFSVSANVTSKDMKDVSYYCSFSSNPGDRSVGATSGAVTSSNQYLRVHAKGTKTDRLDYNEYLRISDVVFTIRIKSVRDIDAFNALISDVNTYQPVTTAWDGTTKYNIATSASYSAIRDQFNSNNNVVGNLGDWGLHDGDQISTTSSTLTSLRTDGKDFKQFSFLLFDKFLGLNAADINGFDLMQAYRGTNAITNGDAKTYSRSGYNAEQLKTLRYPTGIRSITVQPFAFADNNAASGSFRGLYVTVIYDGLGNPKKDGDAPQALEIETGYRINYSNIKGVSGNTLTVFCGGIDYTAPDKLKEFDIITKNVYNENDGVTYFYTDTIQFKPILDNDDIRGDVKYYFFVYKKDKNGDYQEVAADKIKVFREYNNEVKEIVRENGYRIENPGFEKITLKNLDFGEYAVRFLAVDTVGQYYANLVEGKNEEQIGELLLNDYQKSWAEHIVYSDYCGMTIDANVEPPKEWKKSVTLDNGATYGGEWTNRNVIISFEKLVSNLGVKYQISYRNLKNGVFIGTQTDWTDIELTADNKYVIGYDENSSKGFEREYYLRAIYPSSITYDVKLTVKYDSYKGYTPYVARLLDFASDEAYADLLPLLVNLNYKEDGGTEYVNEFLGSPMKLYYKIGRKNEQGVYVETGDPKEIPLDSNDVYMDLFEGKNVLGRTQIRVRFWLVDDAGNENHGNYYYVNLDRAQLQIKFNIEKSAKRYFDNTVKVKDGLVSYTLWNKFAGTIPSKAIGITFDAAYDDVNAGARNVRISNIQAAYVEGSAYTKALIEEYEKVYVKADGNVITPEADGSYVIGTHEIKKARLVLDTDAYRLTAIYNGSYEYAIPDFITATGSLQPYDKVVGDKKDEWKIILWKGKFQIDKLDIKDGIPASLINYEISGDLNKNYQIVHASGSSDMPRSYVNINKAKLGKITIIASKEYDGVAEIGTTFGNCRFIIEDICESDKGRLSLGYNKYVMPDKNAGEHIFKVDNYTLVGERWKFYDTSDITVEAKVTVTRKTITVSVSNVEKPFDNKTTFQIDGYSFNGVFPGDKVKLYTSAGNTASVNVGEYKDCKVTMRLDGENKDNYILKETEAVVSVTIKPREIGGARIVGIYAVDKNGNYYYIRNVGENQVVIYQKYDAGYMAYSRDAQGKAVSEFVPELPEDAIEWVTDTFVTDGACIVNGHRFELSKEAVYAIEYYEDTACQNKLDIGAIDFTQLQYQPVVVDQNDRIFRIDSTGGNYNNCAYEYTLRILRFANESNFTKKIGYNDNEPKIVRILDFSDVKFKDNLFNDKYKVEENKFSVPYNAAAYSLDVGNEYDMEVVLREYFKKDKAGVWQPVEAAVNAGQYYGKFTIKRSGYEYILERTFIIERIETVISLNDASITYDAKYGENFTEKVQKIDNSFYYYRDTLGMVIGENDIVYEYSYDKNFGTKLDGAPVRQGGGICYVRVRYIGNDNFLESVSEARAIKVSGAIFNLVNITVNVGDSFNLPTIASVIDPAYRDVQDDFRIVYLVNTAKKGQDPVYIYKVVTDPSGLNGEGRYQYTVVHKELVRDGKRIDDTSEGNRYTLAVSYKGKNTAEISIIETALDSVNGGDAHISDIDLLEPNDIGSISGSWTQADGGYSVYFCILDKSNAANRDNFTNGLIKNESLFGKKYAAGKVFLVSLCEYMTDNNGVYLNPDKQPKLAGKATVTMSVSANGAKLVRYNNGDWSEVDYVDNGDGTVTFETDKLGYFIFADDYVAPTADINKIAIGVGAGVGGLALLTAIIVVAAVVIKRKRA